MTRAVRTLVVGALLFLPALAQSSDKSSERRFPLVQINVSGSQRYTKQAIIASLGLRTGQQTSQAELERASQRLTATGLFSHVEFRFGWAGDGATVNFDLQDNTNLVPIEFENLVWFTPRELTSSIKQRLPLFSGVVPLSGSFNEELREALQKLVVGRHVKGTVIAIPQGSAKNEVRTMLYRVDGHEVEIKDCEFPGAIHADRFVLFEITKYLTKVRYERAAVNNSLKRRLKDVYDAQGYLSASFPEPEVKLISSTPERTEISLISPVVEGHAYTFSGVEWHGNTIYSSEDLTAALKFRPGQIASLSKFGKDLDSVRELYGRRGHVGLRIEFTPVLSPDDSAKFRVGLDEGRQYRVGKVELKGIDADAISKLMSDWQMLPGQIYDAGYPQEFMSNDFGRHIAQPNLWEWSKRESMNEQAGTVDLLIELSPTPKS